MIEPRRAQVVEPTSLRHFVAPWLRRLGCGRSPRCATHNRTTVPSLVAPSLAGQHGDRPLGSSAGWPTHRSAMDGGAIHSRPWSHTCNHPLPNTWALILTLPAEPHHTQTPPPRSLDPSIPRSLSSNARVAAIFDIPARRLHRPGPLRACLVSKSLIYAPRELSILRPLASRTRQP